MSRVVTEEYLNKVLDEKLEQKLTTKLKDYPTRVELNQILDERFDKFRIEMTSEMERFQTTIIDAIKEEWRSNMAILKEGFDLHFERSERYEKDNKTENKKFDRRLLALE